MSCFSDSTRETLFWDSYRRMETDRLEKFKERLRKEPGLLFRAPFASLVNAYEYQEFWHFRLKKVWKGLIYS